MKWMNSKQIEQWAEQPAAKAELPLLISRLIRATTLENTELKFPSGADTYLGGWDGVTRCAKATAWVTEGVALWEMGSDVHIQAKADDDYKKRTANPLGYNNKDCVFVFVTPRRWPGKDTWVAEKNAEGIWKDVLVYDAIRLEEWLLDAPAVGWWLAVQSGNMPAEGILAAEQAWEEYAEGPKITLSPAVLTCSRAKQRETVQEFMAGSAGMLAIKARSREEAAAFAVASMLELDGHPKEDFLARALVVEDVTSFRSLANNRYGLVMIAKFDEVQPLTAAVKKGHHVVVAAGADDSHDAGNPLVLPSVGRELETALRASGMPPDQAQKMMTESGRDLTILRKLLGFPTGKVEWASPQYAALLLPALFLGRWNEDKPGDIEMLQALAGESYDSYIQKLHRWLNVPHPFVYRIGSNWRLASPLDAWTVLAGLISRQQLDRLEETVVSVLSQVKPQFELEPEKRYMAALYGKQSLYSRWAREGVCQSLILFALFGKSLGLVTEDSQYWVDRVVGRILSSREQDLWRSLNDVLPLLAEAAPERFLSRVYALLIDNSEIVMGMFTEDPSPLTPTSHHTGLLWALEALAWFAPWLKRVTFILIRLAAEDPGGSITNRPRNSLSAIYLPWMPQTFADRFQRGEILAELVQRDASGAWPLLVSLLPESHPSAFPTARTRWREFGVEANPLVKTYAELWAMDEIILDLLLVLAGADEERLDVLLRTADNMGPGNRRKLFDHLISIADRIQQTSFCLATTLRNELHHHREFPEQKWALPESELKDYEDLLKLLEPHTPIETCRLLFDVSHPRFPELLALDRHDWQAEENLILEKRIEAVKSVYASAGIDGLIALGSSVTEKRYFGDTVAHCLYNEDEQLKLLLHVIQRESTGIDLAWAFSCRMAVVHGFGWVEHFFQLLIAAEIDQNILAKFLSWVPLSSEVYRFVSKQDAVLRDGFWSARNIFLGSLTDEEKAGAVDQLMTVGKYAAAVSAVNLWPNAFTTGKSMDVLLAAGSKPDMDGRRPQSHEVERILAELYRRGDYDSHEMSRVELFCLRFVSFDDRATYSKVLQDGLAVDPGLFVELLEQVYKPDNCDDASLLAAKRTPVDDFLAYLASLVLHDWEHIPGKDADGVIDKEALQKWVDEARRLAAEKDRLKCADRNIGQVLGRFRRKALGQAPPDAVRGTIDRINTQEIRSGFHAAVFNRTSMSSRGLFVGGDRERGISAAYRQVADSLMLMWPVTAGIFISLADSYGAQANEHDVQAQKDSLE